MRRVTEADAQLVLEVLNDPAFIEYVADRGVRTREDAARYIREKFFPSYEQHGFGFYAVELKETGTPVGICGLIKREFIDDVDVGFSILRPFWGNGYATEAARAVMQYGRETFGLPRVVGIAAPENARSIAVLEKLGLRFERMIQMPGYALPGKLFA